MKTSIIDPARLKVTRKIKQDMLDDYGYYFCKKCNRSNQYYYEIHHIIYRSEAPKHKNLHNERNLIFLCEECHKKYHSKIYDRAELVIDRKLWELFPEYVRPEFYIDN